MSAPGRSAGTRLVDGLARPFGWGLLFAVAAAFLAFGSIHPPVTTAAQRIAQLDSVIKCPSCADLSIGQSDDPVAAALRREVATLVHQGVSDATIENRVVARYGSTVLLSPPAHGLDAALWIVPIVVVVLGAGAIAFVLVRRRQGSDDGSSDEDEALVSAALAERGGRS